MAEYLLENIAHVAEAAKIVKRLSAIGGEMKAAVAKATEKLFLL